MARNNRPGPDRGPMRSYPCEITGEPATSDAAGLQRQVHEGDEITLERPSDKAGQPSPVACFHGGRFIGHIREGRPWVRRSLLEGDRHQVRVTGFDTNEAQRKGGIGLLSMKERVRLIGGELILKSKPGDGTRIEIRAPLPKDLP